MAAELKHLDEHRAAVLENLCETIVPGSRHVKPVVYIDAIMADMPVPQRDALIHSIDALEGAAPHGPEGLAPHTATPAFQFIRALAIEAYYSDFLAPGAAGPTAYEEIDFHSPLAMRIKKDWSYLGLSAPAGGASVGSSAAPGGDASVGLSAAPGGGASVGIEG
jgi:hypothetical protein